MSEPLIRPRREDDLPAVAALLIEQQRAGSGYPYRHPLPMPPEEFVVRGTELAAWVVELDGVLGGHVAIGRVEDPAELPAGDADVVRAWLAAHGRAREELGEVGVLFAGPTARGRGVGSLLLATAVDALRERDLGPCLDVLPTNAATLRLYQRSGWVEVGRARPSWLSGDAPDVLAMVLPGA